MRRIGRTLLMFLLAVGILPLIVPIPPLTSTRPVEELVTDGRLLRVGSVRTHVVESGDGPGTPLVLLHGFAASTRSFDAVLPALSNDRRVKAYDRPGFGITERPLPPGAPNPYANAHAPDFTVDLMTAAGIDSAILIGHSAGGAVALHTALRYPERVPALILVAPAVFTEAATSRPLRALLQTPQLQRLGPWMLRLVSRFGDRGLDLAWADEAGVPEQVRDDYRYPLQAQDWDRGLWEILLAHQPLSLANELASLDLPVLIITGDQDRIIPPEESVRLAEQLPDAHLVIFENCGHLPHEEFPERFIDEVQRFLQSLDGLR